MLSLKQKAQLLQLKRILKLHIQIILKFKIALSLKQK